MVEASRPAGELPEGEAPVALSPATWKELNPPMTTWERLKVKAPSAELWDHIAGQPALHWWQARERPAAETVRQAALKP